MKIKTIDITANQYHDKINGNTYFNADMIINYNTEGQVTIHLPMQYGNNNQYLFAALNMLNELKFIDFTGPLWLFCQNNNIELRTNLREGYKERELRSQDKAAIPLNFA
jgi:hypothetical protein